MFDVEMVWSGVSCGLSALVRLQEPYGPWRVLLALCVCITKRLQRPRLCHTTSEPRGRDGVCTEYTQPCTSL